MFDSPDCAAALELVVAARTDPGLAVVVQAVSVRFRQGVTTLFTGFFPELSGAPFADRLAGFAFAVLQGAVVSGWSGFDDPEHPVGLLKVLVRSAGPDLFALLEVRDDDHDPDPDPGPV